MASLSEMVMTWSVAFSAITLPAKGSSVEIEDVPVRPAVCEEGKLPADVVGGVGCCPS